MQFYIAVYDNGNFNVATLFNKFIAYENESRIKCSMCMYENDYFKLKYQE